MVNRLLPDEFAELEPFAPTWCLATETERYERRMNSSMDEMVTFYEAFFPRLEEAIEYCDTYPLDALTDEATNLLRLVYSLVMVSMSVEIFAQPKAVDAADAELVRIREPLP